MKYNPPITNNADNITIPEIISWKTNQPKNDATIGSPSGTEITIVVGKNFKEYDKIPWPNIVGIIPKRIKIIYSLYVKFKKLFSLKIIIQNKVKLAELNKVRV